MRSASNVPSVRSTTVVSVKVSGWAVATGVTGATTSSTLANAARDTDTDAGHQADQFAGDRLIEPERRVGLCVESGGRGDSEQRQGEASLTRQSSIERPDVSWGGAGRDQSVRAYPDQPDDGDISEPLRTREQRQRIGVPGHHRRVPRTRVIG